MTKKTRVEIIKKEIANSKLDGELNVKELLANKQASAKKKQDSAKAKFEKDFADKMYGKMDPVTGFRSKPKPFVEQPKVGKKNKHSCIIL